MKKPFQEWPKFFGINHYAGGGKGMKETLAALARPGNRCFIEVPQRLANTYNKGHIAVLKNNDSAATYLELMEWLHEEGVKLIALDREMISRLFKTPKTTEYKDTHIYVMNIIRERSWHTILRTNANSSDFVVMHPVHLARVQRTWGIPKNLCVFVDKIPREWRPWIGTRSDRRLQKKRLRYKRQKHMS